jgi:hypothetical protein
LLSAENVIDILGAKLAKRTKAIGSPVAAVVGWAGTALGCTGVAVASWARVGMAMDNNANDRINTKNLRIILLLSLHYDSYN